MFDDDHYGKCTSALKFNVDSGYYMQGLESLSFIAGKRAMQILYGYGVGSGDVLSGDAVQGQKGKKGKKAQDDEKVKEAGRHYWHLLTHHEQKAKRYFNFMPSDRAVRPREVCAAAAPPPRRRASAAATPPPSRRGCAF